MNKDKFLEKIVIIDYGSQFTQLIARKIRECGVYSEIINISKIKDFPNEYNVMRLQLTDGYTGKIKIMHWTGQKGKEKIRSML